MSKTVASPYLSLSVGILERDREAEARVLYHAWVLQHLGGNSTPAHATTAKPPAHRKASPDVLSGSLLEIGSALIDSERSRSRTGDEPRRRGTIAAPVFRDRKKQIHDFLAFLNTRYGPWAVARMRLTPRAGTWWPDGRSSHLRRD